VKIYSVILTALIFISCSPPSDDLAREKDAAEARMELKNIWILLEEYREINGSFPDTLRLIENEKAFDLKKWTYDPNAEIVVWSNDNRNRKRISLRADGEIITE
jgi:hypothetical protein